MNRVLIKINPNGSFEAYTTDRKCAVLIWDQRPCDGPVAENGLSIASILEGLPEHNPDLVNAAYKEASQALAELPASANDLALFQKQMLRGFQKALALEPCPSSASLDEEPPRCKG